MKLIHLLWLILLIVSCEKEKTLTEICGIEAPEYWNGKAGIANASTNLPHWEDMRCWARVHKDLFSVEMTKWYRPCDKILCTITGLPFLQRDSISNLNNTIDPQASLWLVHGEDAFAEYFDILEDADNWITIDGFNADSTEIWGRYNLTFVLSPFSVGKGLYDPTFPDTIFVKDGVYTTRILIRS
jgi:hypothetical protein